MRWLLLAVCLNCPDGERSPHAVARLEGVDLVTCQALGQAAVRAAVMAMPVGTIAATFCLDLDADVPFLYPQRRGRR